jgi:hypothetical protein
MMDGYLPPYPNGAVFGYNTANLTATPLYFQTTQGLLERFERRRYLAGGCSASVWPGQHGDELYLPQDSQRKL